MDAKDASSCDHNVDRASSSQFGMDGDRAEGDAFLRKTEVVPEKKSTLDELLEMVQQLRQSQEEQNKLVKRQAKEIKKLKKSHIRFVNNVKYLFRNEWEVKMQEWKEEMEKLRKEETELEWTLEGLKNLVRDIGGKEDEILKLKKKLVQLEERRSRASPSNVTVEHVKEVGESERKDALHIFPEEVWEMIFGKLSDSSDLSNCYNTCSLFRQLLHDWRTSWVFEQTLPHFFQYLPGEALLKCRTISKGWMTAVDNHLEDHPSLRPHTDPVDPRKLEFINPLEESGVGRRNEFSFSSEEDVCPKIPEFPCKNVFIGRNVIMNIDEGGDEREDGGKQLWSRVNQFLTKFGKDIWYLTISFRAYKEFETRAAQQKVVEFLTTLFTLAPNLRKLRIDDSPYMDDLEMQHALPPAINLETFEAKSDDEDYHHYPIITALLSHYHTQLRRLDLTEDIWVHVDSLGWPNLSELHLTIRDVQYFEVLDSLWEGMPELRKLGFQVEVDSLKDYAKFLADLHKITSITRLTTLSLHFNFHSYSGYVFEGEWDDEIIQLLETNCNLRVSPTLTTIQVHHDHGMAIWARAYNFLLRFFPLIKNLHVFKKTKTNRWSPLRTERDLLEKPENESRRLEKSGRYKRGEELVEINKYAYDGEMYRSNIWELFPRLQVFTFQWDLYTRKGYDDYIQRKSHSEVSSSINSSVS